jgi:hypothetical protein
MFKVNESESTFEVSLNLTWGVTRATFFVGVVESSSHRSKVGT